LKTFFFVFCEEKKVPEFRMGIRNSENGATFFCSPSDAKNPPENLSSEKQIPCLAKKHFCHGELQAVHDVSANPSLVSEYPLKNRPQTNLHIMIHGISTVS